MIVGSFVRRARVIMGNAVHVLFDSVTPATEHLHRPTAGRLALTVYLCGMTKQRRMTGAPTAIDGDRTGIRL